MIGGRGAISRLLYEFRLEDHIPENLLRITVAGLRR